MEYEKVVNYVSKEVTTRGLSLKTKLRLNAILFHLSGVTTPTTLRIVANETNIPESRMQHLCNYLLKTGVVVRTSLKNIKSKKYPVYGYYLNKPVIARIEK